MKKKKIIVEKSDLENLVKMVIKENEDRFYDEDEGVDPQQSSLDFSQDEIEEYSSILDLAEDRYNDIVQKIGSFFSDGKCNKINDECYDKMDDIYNNDIFPVFRELGKLSHNYIDKHLQSSVKRLGDVQRKFVDLEDAVVSYMEIYKSFEKLENEFQDTVTEVENIIKKGT